jgi:hypothetical protein
MFRLATRIYRLETPFPWMLARMIAISVVEGQGRVGLTKGGIRIRKPYFPFFHFNSRPFNDVAIYRQSSKSLFSD